MFQDQTIVVTGGAQGIGRAVAEYIASRGGRIVIWDADGDLARATAAEIGAGAVSFQADVRDWSSVAAACAATCDSARAGAGRIDALIHAAGIAGPNAPLAEYDIDAFAEIQAVNLNGTFHVNRAVVPVMMAQNYGRIVNVASVAGKEGNPNASAYSASKAGVIALTKSLGKELANFDIAVNCVTPAAARTRIFDQMREEHIAYMLSKIPRGRFLELTEAAAMIAWLASRENSFATGAVYDLSGGRATY